jgi:hypothetical protein
MKLEWIIEEQDVQKAKRFFETRKESPFVLQRIKRNVKKDLPVFSKDLFWKAMVSCLITTQQRSGPNSSVTKFLCTVPFPLSFSSCKQWDRLETAAQEIITNFGGLRRGKTIGEELRFNLNWLDKDGWQIVFGIVERLMSGNDKITERRSAELIIDHLKGFGPKQSRNLLQSLGLTIFEIPVDSRIIKWLTKFGFPIKLSGIALSDQNYYNFVLDGFQRICEACDIPPCVMDAAIFSSFDEEWTDEKLVW